MEVSGVPSFAPGERALLFVERNGTQFCPLVGVMHGRYRIAQRASDGVEVVFRDNGTPLGSRLDVAQPMHRGAAADVTAQGAAAAPAALPLAQFEAEIAAEVANAAAR